MIVRSPELKDAERINEIYNHYVMHSTCTFDEQFMLATNVLNFMSVPWQSLIYFVLFLQSCK